MKAISFQHTTSDIFEIRAGREIYNSMSDYTVIKKTEFNRALKQFQAKIGKVYSRLGVNP